MTILNGLSRKRGAWTPAKLGGLGAYWWDAASGVTLREAGPDWPSQGSHARGLDFDGTNYVDMGDNALYDDTAIALSITVLAYVDASEQAGLNAYLYSEGNSGSSTQHFGIAVKNTAGQMFMVLYDDAGTPTSQGFTKNGVITDKAWNVITVVLDASGWGVVVNGVEKLTLGGTAYQNSPATTTFDRATIGALGKNTYSAEFAGPIAYGMRHNSALTLAQCRQVQQYIAEQVAGDGISLTIAGSETANANSPLNHWPFSEDAAGANVEDIAGSVTGYRRPGDCVTTLADRLQGVSIAQSTTSDQPTYETVGGLPAICTPGNTTQSLHGLFGETIDGCTILVAYAKLQDTSSGNRGYVWDGQNASKRVPIFGRFAVQFASYFDDGGGNGDRTYTGTDATALKSAGGTLVNRVYGSSAAPILHVNGGAGVATADTPTTGELTLDGITVGNAYESGKATSSATLQKIREIVVVPGDVGVDTINQWLAYCKRRYGLAYTEAS